MNAPLPKVTDDVCQYEGIVIADARRVSASDFHKLFEPRESELDRLCKQLWTAAVENDRERIAELHAQIKSHDRIRRDFSSAVIL